MLQIWSLDCLLTNFWTYCTFRLSSPAFLSQERQSKWQLVVNLDTVIYLKTNEIRATWLPQTLNVPVPEERGAGKHLPFCLSGQSGPNRDTDSLTHSIVFSRTQMLFPAGKLLLGWESWAASHISSCHASAHRYMSWAITGQGPSLGVFQLSSLCISDLWDLSSLPGSLLQSEQSQDLHRHLSEVTPFQGHFFFLWTLFFSTSSSVWHPKRSFFPN